jgi:hypothetical protein
MMTMQSDPVAPDGAIAVNLMGVISTLRFLRIVYTVVSIILTIFSLALFAAYIHREITSWHFAPVAFIGGWACGYRAYRFHRFLTAARAGQPMVLVANALQVVANSRLGSLNLDSGAIARITDPRVPAAHVTHKGKVDSDRH